MSSESYAARSVASGGHSRAAAAAVLGRVQQQQDCEQQQQHGVGSALHAASSCSCRISLACIRKSEEQWSMVEKFVGVCFLGILEIWGRVMAFR